MATHILLELWIWRMVYSVSVENLKAAIKDYNHMYITDSYNAFLRFTWSGVILQCNRPELIAAVMAFIKRLSVSNKWIILSVLATAGNSVDTVDWSGISSLPVVITFT